MRLKYLLFSVFTFFSVSMFAQNSTETSTQPIANQIYSDYAGLEQKISKHLKGDVIPASLPKYVKGQTLEEYKDDVRAWGLKHQELLAAEAIEKLKSKQL